jgi:hypothetical protein
MTAAGAIFQLVGRLGKFLRHRFGGPWVGLPMSRQRANRHCRWFDLRWVILGGPPGAGADNWPEIRQHHEPSGVYSRAAGTRPQVSERRFPSGNPRNAGAVAEGMAAEVAAKPPEMAATVAAAGPKMAAAMTATLPKVAAPLAAVLRNVAARVAATGPEMAATMAPALTLLPKLAHRRHNRQNRHPNRHSPQAQSVPKLAQPSAQPGEVSAISGASSAIQSAI